ncbi:hypothetical protein SLEP1_g53309 [Rubroshorea leprosula]|uniref:SF3A2 domain-containing protein n=1 Tax=Rubroshorea leprosula TaxID=152421 RepID=A0AAV5M961_9ROSI|nr:hypothetical protein SLEP1_g53309 [Rubroshorea leprosula]
MLCHLMSRGYQYLLFAVEPYKITAFKVPALKLIPECSQ